MNNKKIEWSKKNVNKIKTPHEIPFLILIYHQS